MKYKIVKHESDPFTAKPGTLMRTITSETKVFDYITYNPVKF